MYIFFGAFTATLWLRTGYCCCDCEGRGRPRSPSRRTGLRGPLENAEVAAVGRARRGSPAVGVGGETFGQREVERRHWTWKTGLGSQMGYGPEPRKWAAGKPCKPLRRIDCSESACLTHHPEKKIHTSIKNSDSSFLLYYHYRNFFLNPIK